MIRVNLIAGERRTAKAAGKSFQIGQKATLAGSLILVLTAAGVGWRYWMVTRAEAQVTSDIAAAKREELQRRVALIDELRKGQTAPVHMVDEISRSLPDMTWLTNVKQEGYDITLQGRCVSLTALSDFVGNLEATRYFRKPVEIVSSEVVAGDKSGLELISFTVKGTFQMAGIDQSAPAAKPGKKPAAPAKRGARG